MTYPNVPITQTPDWVRRAGQAINYILNLVPGTVSNSLTITNTGGAAPGATFNGSAAKTIDYSTVGAAPVSNGIPKGTSFPGSPASGDRFFRTDRGIDYYYDGTRWLSTQIFIQQFAVQDQVNPIIANTTQRANNPWWSVYDMYVLTLVVECTNTATTAANYVTIQMKTSDGAIDTNFGSSISTQNDTQNAHVGHLVTINSTISSAVEGLSVAITKTGSPNIYVTGGINFRLIG